MKHGAMHAEREMADGSAMWRYVHRIAFAKEYFLMAGLLVFVVAGLTLVTYGGVEVLSAVRAYTNAEALYSKAQKDAVYYLHQYAVSGQEEYYLKYRAAIAVPLGYRQARVELEKSQPDSEVIREGMLQGHSHPEDASIGSVWIYRMLRRVGPATRVIRFWREADLLVAQLQNVANLVRTEVSAGTPDAERLAGLLQEVERINVNLTTLEDAFSSTLGQAARWVRRFVLGSVSLAALLLLALGLVPSWRVLSRLKNSEEKFRRLFEQSRDAIVLVTLDGQVAYANPAAFSLFGYPNGAYTQRRLNELSAKTYFADDTERLKLLRALREEGFVQSFECRLRRIDGTELDGLVTSMLIRDRSGRVIGFESILRDVTESKKAEAALRMALAKERELSELQSRFVSMASHEFRTPLATILSSAELVERFRHRWDERQTLKHLRRIQTSVKALTELLENVLLVGKVEAGRLRFEAVELELVDFCRELVDEVWLGHGQGRHITIELPPAPLVGVVDPHLLRSLLSNLLTNAAKYSEPDGDVTFRLTREDGQAIFSVIDNGIGIPEGELPHVLRPFHRAPNVETIPGTGLGLSIAQRAVELHGGTLHIESKEGYGTRVVVLLPLAVEDTTAPASI